MALLSSLMAVLKNKCHLTFSCRFLSSNVSSPLFILTATLYHRVLLFLADFFEIRHFSTHSLMNMRVSLFLIPILSTVIVAELTCYYPDTTVATGHIPCNATASDTPTDASACCSGYGNEYCLANGLCLFDGTLSRGSCTDKNWASPSCSQWCLNGITLFFCNVRIRLIDNIEQRNTSMNIFPCHAQGVWQCEWQDDCASNFTLQTSGISIIVRDDQQPNAPNAMEFADPNAKFVAVSQAKSSSTAATSDTMVSIQTPEISSTSSSLMISDTTTTAAAAASSPSEHVPPNPRPAPTISSTISAGAKAGIAVGVVTGALAVGTLLYYLFVRRRRSRHANTPNRADSGGVDHLCVRCEHLKSELSGQPARMEVDAADVKPELMAQNLRWEMDGGSRSNR